MRWKRILITAFFLVAGYGVYRMSLPRSIRNNNPVNIKEDQVDFQWEGEALFNTDNVFEEFVLPEAGYRAGARIIRNKILRGLVTVEAILRDFAPPVNEDGSFENHTESYIEFVRKEAGFQPGHIVSLSEGDLQPLLRAMAIFEAGALWRRHPSISWQTVNLGVSLIDTTWDDYMNKGVAA